MIKFLIENFLIIVIGLIIITQIIIPSFTGQKYFWLFKKKQTPEVNDLENIVEKKAEEFKDVKAKAEENLKKAQEIKNKTNI